MLKNKTLGYIKPQKNQKNEQRTSILTTPHVHRDVTF